MWLNSPPPTLITSNITKNIKGYNFKLIEIRYVYTSLYRLNSVNTLPPSDHPFTQIAYLNSSLLLQRVTFLMSFTKIAFIKEHFMDLITTYILLTVTLTFYFYLNKFLWLM